MSKMTKRVKNKETLIKGGIGFEWDVKSNYFNKNNCVSDDSDRVSNN